MSALFSEVGPPEGQGLGVIHPWIPRRVWLMAAQCCWHEGSSTLWSMMITEGPQQGPFCPHGVFCPWFSGIRAQQKESFSIRWWLQGSRSTGQPFSGTRLVVREWEVTCRVRRARARGDQGRKTRVFLVLGTVSASGPPEAWMSSGPSAFPECLSRFFISKVSQRYVFIFFLQSNRILAIFTFFTRDKSDLFNKHKASFYIFNNHSKSDSHSTCPLISFWVHFLFKWALLCSLWLKSWGWSIFSN